MTTILGLSGSLRRASVNTGLLRAAVEVAPDGVDIVAGDIRAVPLYDGDLEEADGMPAAVTALIDRLAGADALLLVSPEYNGGVPGVLKNTLDWMSRGAGRTVLRGKPVAVIGASPGPFGSTHAQLHWLPVLRTMAMRPWFEGRLTVSQAGGLFDADGTLTDAATRARLADFITGFATSLRP